MPPRDFREWATYPVSAIANYEPALLIDLEKTTASLRASQHARAAPGDLGAVLTAGAFRRENTQVFGNWPIPRSFIDAVVSSPY